MNTVKKNPRHISNSAKEIEKFNNNGTISAVESNNGDSEEESQSSLHLEDSDGSRSALSFDGGSILSDFKEWKEWSRKKTRHKERYANYSSG